MDDGGTTDDDSASVASADAAGSVMTAPPVPDEPSEAMLTAPTDPHSGTAADRRVTGMAASGSDRADGTERRGSAGSKGAAVVSDSEVAAQPAGSLAAVSGVINADAARWPVERAGAAVAAAGGTGRLSQAARDALTTAVQRLSVLDVDATRRQSTMPRDGAAAAPAAASSAGPVDAPHGSSALLDVTRLRLLRRLARHRRLAGMSLGQSGAVSDDDTVPRARRLRLLGARRRRKQRDRAAARRGVRRLSGAQGEAAVASALATAEDEDDEEDEGVEVDIDARRAAYASGAVARRRRARGSMRARGGGRSAVRPGAAANAGDDDDDDDEEDDDDDVRGVVDAVMDGLGGAEDARHGRRVGSFHVSPSGGRRAVGPAPARRWHHLTPLADVPLAVGSAQLPGVLPGVLTATADAAPPSGPAEPEPCVARVQEARDGDAASLFDFLAAQGHAQRPSAPAPEHDRRLPASRRPPLLRGATPVDGAAARPSAAPPAPRPSASAGTLATRTDSSSSLAGAAHRGSAAHFYAGSSAPGSRGTLLGLDVLDLREGAAVRSRFPLLVAPPAAPLDRRASVSLLQLGAAPRADDSHRLRIRPVRLLASFSGPSALARAWPTLAPAALASPPDPRVRAVVDRAWPTLCGSDYTAAHRHVIRGQSLSAEHLADPRLRFLVALRLDRRSAGPAASVAVGILTGWAAAAPYLLHAELAARSRAADRSGRASPASDAASASASPAPGGTDPGQDTAFVVGPSGGCFSPTLAPSGGSSPSLSPLLSSTPQHPTTFTPDHPPISYAQAASADASPSEGSAAGRPSPGVPPPSPSLFGSLLGVFGSAAATSTSRGAPVTAAPSPAAPAIRVVVSGQSGAPPPASAASASAASASPSSSSVSAMPSPRHAASTHSPASDSGAARPADAGMPPLSLAAEPSSPTASVGAVSSSSSRADAASGGRPPLAPAGSADEEPREEALLRPSPDELELMGLRSGSNKLEFVVPSTGARVECSLFLWRPSDKVVISDVDGTITKSDAMGHLMYWVGADWTQVGVASLFQNIHRNGYKIVYLTSRAIGQVGSTKQYLTGISQPGKAAAAEASSAPAAAASKLPPGPVITSPDRLVDAFTREVILRRPEEFKKRALGDIGALFPRGVTPFYAGFGNRSTDQVSYDAVGVPRERIFIINPSGDISKDGHILFRTYREMNVIVDSVFPAIGTAAEDATDGAAANPARGPSPALSAGWAARPPSPMSLAEPGPADHHSPATAPGSPSYGPSRGPAVGSMPSTRRLGKPTFTDPAFSDASWWPSDSRRRVLVDTAPSDKRTGKPPRM